MASTRVKVGIGAGILAHVHETHTVDLPAPWPLGEADLADLRSQALMAQGPPEADAGLSEGAAADGSDGADTEEASPDLLAGLDLDQVAKDRAIARGEHLVTGRYACMACHGGDLSGGTMVDDPAMGTWLGPNLTLGAGSRIADNTVAPPFYGPEGLAGWTQAQFDAALLEGKRPDGTALRAPMSEVPPIAVNMTTTERNALFAYLQSLPAAPTGK